MIYRNFSKKVTLFVLFTLLYGFSFLVNAEIAPFGIEIGKTTIKELKDKYITKRIGINKYSNGEMHDLINLSQIKFDGIKSICVVFDENKKALAVLTVMHKNKYHKLFDMLASKYKLTDKHEEFVGDQYAEFIDGNTKIFLDAPHMSFDLSLNYIHKDLHAFYLNESSKEKENKNAEEIEQL